MFDAKTILMVAGIGCIVVAILGGGFVALNVNVPVINKPTKQLLLAAFGALLLLGSFLAPGGAIAPTPGVTPQIATPADPQPATPSQVATPAPTPAPTTAPNFSGVWNTSTQFPFRPEINGKLTVTLVQTGTSVSGQYRQIESPTPISGLINGTVAGNVLTYRWDVGGAGGGGHFVLSADGKHMEGPVGFDSDPNTNGTWKGDRQQ